MIAQKRLILDQEFRIIEVVISDQMCCMHVLFYLRPHSRLIVSEMFLSSVKS